MDARTRRFFRRADGDAALRRSGDPRRACPGRCCAGATSSTSNASALPTARRRRRCGPTTSSAPSPTPRSSSPARSCCWWRRAASGSMTRSKNSCRSSATGKVLKADAKSLADVEPAKSPITIRQLLTHTVGLSLRNFRSRLGDLQSAITRRACSIR